LGNLRSVLANRLAMFRARKGWTQHDLAAACVDPATGRARSASWVRGYEQQTRWPDPDDLDLLANALGVSPAAFFGDAEPIAPTPEEALRVLERALDMTQSHNRDPLAARVARILADPDLGETARLALEAVLAGLEPELPAEAGKRPHEKSK
jgi:transcriptional regulator with XRE-family HTH domain